MMDINSGDKAMNKIIFESDEQAIQTAMVMFACSDFRPWTKAKIIKRLRERGMIKNCNKEQSSNKLISDNRDELLKKILYSHYQAGSKVFETFQMYLNRILNKDK